MIAILVSGRPYLVFIASTRGLLQYIADLAPQAQSLSQVRTGLLPMSIDRSEPLAERGATIGATYQREMGRRSADDGARKDLEQQHGLVSPEQIDGSTWSYVPLNIERSHIRTLINDSGRARHARHQPAPPSSSTNEIPFYLGLQRQYSFLRVRLAPGLFSRGNARAWFYDITLLTPIIGRSFWPGCCGATDRQVRSLGRRHGQSAVPDHRADDRARCGRVTPAGRRKPDLRGRCLADRTLPQAARRV